MRKISKIIDLKDQRPERGGERRRKKQTRKTNGGAPTGVGLAKTAVLPPQ